VAFWVAPAEGEKEVALMEVMQPCFKQGKAFVIDAKKAGKVWVDV